jgi:hypothetical protein
MTFELGVGDQLLQQFAAALPPVTTFEPGGARFSHFGNERLCGWQH